MTPRILFLIRIQGEFYDLAEVEQMHHAVTLVMVFPFGSGCSRAGPGADSRANPKLKTTCLYLVLSGVTPTTTGPVIDHSMRLLIFC